jgi:hypothetical protein
VNGLEVHNGTRHDSPDVLGDRLNQGRVKLLVEAIAPARRQDDNPEQDWAFLIALVRVLLSKHREESMEVLQISLHPTEASQHIQDPEEGCNKMIDESPRRHTYLSK